MENNYIELRKERSFGDVFNAAFNFIKQEFKNLFKAIAIYALPFLLIAAIGYIYYMYSISGLNLNGNPNFSDIGKMYAAMVPMMIFSLIGYCMLFCTVYSYIKLYLERGNGNFNVKELTPIIKKVFFPVLGVSFISYMIVAAGTIMCIIPGIYLSVVLSIAPVIVVIEGNGFSAIERSFKLMKNQWFNTFGLLIVITIITYMLIVIAAIPSMVMGFSNLFSLSNQLNMGTQILSVPYLIVTAITNIVSYSLGVIPIVLIAFQYFNLAEIHEKPSLINKIDSIN